MASHLIHNLIGILFCAFGGYNSERTTSKSLTTTSNEQTASKTVATVPQEHTTGKTTANSTNVTHAMYFGISENFSPPVESTMIEREDFEKTVQSSSYIDKTWFIRNALDLPKYSAITGPRGFSKTTNLNMLKSFFEHELDATHSAKDPKLSKKLQTFKNKKIFTDEKFFWQHFAKYPIIHIDQSEVVKAKNLDNFLKSFVEHCIDPLVVKFGYLLNSTDVRSISKTERSRFVKGYNWTKEELQEFGADLAGLLFQHHGTKPILLIDEYDSPFVSALLDTGVSEKNTEAILQFLGSFLAEMIKHNHDTFRAILTGCVNLKLEQIPNLRYLSIFESKELYSAYGFQETDIDELQNRFAVAPSEMDILKLYYRGYNVFENLKDTFGTIRATNSPDSKIYNTQSVLHSLRRRAVERCWNSGGLIQKFRPLLGVEIYGPSLEECVLRRCKITVKGPMKKVELMQFKKSLMAPNSSDAGAFLFQLLLETGYFTIEEKKGVSHIITSPNFEVQTVSMDEFYRSTYLHSRYNYTPEEEENYVSALDQLSANVTTFHTLVQSVQTLFRNLMPGGELFMQAVLVYPLLRSKKFVTFRIEKYSNPESRYAVFARRWRDSAGIFFDMKTGPEYLKSLDRDMKGALLDIFKEFPDLKDTADVRLVVSAENEVYGFYNYSVFKGDSTCELWPPLKNITREDSGTRSSTNSPRANASRAKSSRAKSSRSRKKKRARG
ncbi:unnamed protein product [Bemisia tabaci]|uniref:AAA-ATPase-like domain-containing protein n=1 Tax=Bemisia tabaci TaxID=7038 RepID=A0A9P0CAK8_BEMTA|nr:unnamed protein product [Bemisia tabaci]